MTKAVFQFFLLLLASRALCQQEHVGFTSASSLNLTATNYYFAKQNELTIVVTVIGQVQRPGRYEISKSIDLVNLIGLAGGANADGSLADVTITRLVDQRGLIKRSDVKVNLADLTTVTSADLLVSPGDVISVGRSTWATVRDVFLVTASAAVITTAVSQVILLTRK